MNFFKNISVKAGSFSNWLTVKSQKFIETRICLSNSKLSTGVHRMFFLPSSRLFKVSTTFVFSIILLFSVTSSAFALSGSIFYTDGSTTLKSRTYSGASTITSSATTLATATLGGWTKSAASPISGQFIVGTTRSSTLYLYVCSSGTSCTLSQTINSVGPNNAYPYFDIAYQSNGNAIVVYRSATNLVYRTYNGSTWSAESSVIGTANAPFSIRLLPDGVSNKIMMMLSNNNNRVETFLWNGSSWSDNSSSSGSTSSCTISGTNNNGYQFDGAWYSNGTKFIGVCGILTDAARYAIYNGSSWTTTYGTGSISGFTDLNHIDLFANAFDQNIVGIVGVGPNGSTGVTLRMGVWDDAAGMWTGTDSETNATNASDINYPASGAWLNATKGIAVYSFNSSGSLRSTIVSKSGSTWSWSTAAYPTPLSISATGASNRILSLYDNPGHGYVLMFMQSSDNILRGYTWDGTTYSDMSTVQISADTGTDQIPFDFDWGSMPTISSLNSSVVSTAGGSVTITGTNYIQSGITTGATSTEVVVGTGTATSSATITAISDTSITATLPALSAGSKTIRVKNLVTGKYVSTTITYQAPPTVSTPSPSTVSTTGGVTVTLTGSSMKTGASAAVLDPNGTATSITNGGSSSSFTFSAPANSAGAYTLRVFGTNGTTANGIYTDVTLTYQAPPTVTSVTPSNISKAGGTTITVVGTGFTSGSTIKIGGTSATNVTFVNSTQLTATSPATTTAGTYTVRVYVSGGSESNGLYADGSISYPEFSQSGYRWFSNANSTTPGAVAAALNTAANFSAQGEVLRLRTTVHFSSGGSNVGDSFKLQVASTTSACSTGATFYDVSASSGAIRFYDNNFVTDAATYVSTANDPTHSSHTNVGQRYVESNNFTTRAVIASGEDGIWDFSLVNSSAIRGTNYCFRIVKADGTVFESYDQIPSVSVPNLAPELQNVSASQSLTVGTVAISYETRDVDTDSGTTAGTILPTFEYKLANGNSWTAITAGYLGASDLSAKSVNQSTYTSHTATWNALSQLGQQYSSTVYVRVTVNDSELTSNTALATTSSFTVDTNNPAISTKSYDARNNLISLSSTDNSTLEYRLSNNSDFSADGINGTSGTWTSASATSISTTTLSWTAATTTGNYEIVYLGVRDVYGNSTTTYFVSPHTPTGLSITDISNISKSTYSEYLSWVANTATSSATLDYYEIWRSTDGETYSLLTTTSNTEYTNTSLDSALTYYYKITAKNTDGSYSDYTSAVSDRPGSSANVAPTFDEAFDSTNGTGIIFSQISDSTSENWGKTQIQYRLKDTDSESLTFVPTFQYNIGAGWVNVDTSTLRVADYASQVVATSSYTTYTAIWDAASQSGLSEIYNGSFRVRVSVNDSGLINSTSTAESAPGTLDTKKPTVLSTSLLINGSSSIESATSTVTLTLQNIFGDTDNETVYVQFSSDNTNWYGADNDSTLSPLGEIGSGFSRATSTLASLSWNWSLSNATSTLYMRVTDSYGNNRSSYSTDTATVSFNIPPQFNAAYGTNGITLTQISDSVSADWGKLRIQYSVRDTDNSTGYITPSFEYNTTGLTWLPITSGYVQATDLNQKAIDVSTYTTYEAIWDADEQLSNSYISNLQIRVTANDGDDASATATSTASIDLDVKIPVTTFSVDSRVDVVNINATDDNVVGYRISNDSTFSGVEWTSAAATTASTSPSWSLSADVNGFETVYYGVRDSFGNTATSSSTAPPAPTGVLIQDTTDLENSIYKELVSWNTYTSTSSAPFASYGIYRATSTEDVYTQIAEVTNISQNYYLDTTVATGTVYYYKIATKTTNADYSGFSSSVTDTPDGVGGVDTTVLAIEDVTQAEVQATWINFTWNTTKLATSVISYSTQAAGTYASTATSSSLVTDHSVSLTSLEPNTTYVYRITASDIGGTSADPVSGTFTTAEGPEISSVAVELADDNRATITWNTNIDANSTVVFSTSASNLNTNTSVTETGNSSPVGGDGPLYQHRVTLSGLTSATKYYFYVKSTSNDGLSNIVTDKNGGDYHTFSTTYDTNAPTISGVTTLLVARNSAVVSWITNEPATSQSLYATVSGSSTNSYANQTTLDEALSTYHVVTFSNLTSETTYYFKVRSADNAGNLGTSNEGTFTTSNEPIAVYITSSGDGLGTGGITGTGEEADTKAPTISNAVVSDVGPFEATVSFSSDEDTVAFIEFGQDKKYELTAANSNYSRSHKVKLRGLKLGTEYFIRVKAQDKSGNFTIDDGLSVKTKFAAEDLDDLVALEDTSQIQDKLDNLIESLAPSLVPPFIGDINVSEISGSSALITWKTNIKTYGSVSFASDTAYASGTDKIYNQEVSDTEEKTTAHEVRLLNLLPGTKYNYQIRAFSIPGVVRETANLTFATRLSKLNPEVYEVTNKGFKVRWNTDKPTSSFVEYKDTSTGQLDVSGSQVKTTNHIVEVRNLAPGKTFEIRSYGFDVNENPTDSSPQIVRIPRDGTAPLITGLKIDNSFVPGRTDRIQTVVSWRTNEPAFANILYEEGSNSTNPGAELKNSVGLTDGLGTSHNIIVPNLKPGTIYRMQVVAIDEFGNKTASPVRSIITPLQTKSVFDVILKNFEDTFQFLR